MVMSALAFGSCPAVAGLQFAAVPRGRPFEASRLFRTYGSGRAVVKCALSSRANFSHATSFGAIVGVGTAAWDALKPCVGQALADTGAESPATLLSLDL